ncbi:M8 family metallopeptidase [Mariniblastus fucicola]|nr:peptidase [Mariniblastus fucicola]
MRSLLCLVALCLTTIATPASAQVTPFNIELNYSAGALPFQSAFEAAEARWESIITGWTDGTNITSTNGGNSFYNLGDNLSSMFIEANVGAIDGVGGILGSAGPSEIVNDGNQWLTTHGAMTFDSADLADLSSDGTLEDVILHEMGHVLGIGTLWTTNNLYNNGSGQYTGANAIAQYQVEFDAGATFVPVELNGGAGTANGHWDEGSITVIDPNNINFGRTRSGALMTGFLDTTDPYISNTTGGTLEDLGYSINYAAIQGVPEPSSAVAIILFGIVGLGRRRRA